jgi:hypothetical protein
MYVNPDEQVYLYVHGASNVSSGLTGVLSDGWHFICGVSDGSKIKIYADGVLGSSATLATGDLSNSAAELHVGIEYDEANYQQTGSLSLLRISATAPTPQQIKEIYEAEKPLFAANAKCLLQSDDAGPNVINALSHDKSTDLLHVFQNGNAVGETMFRGLEAVDSYGGQSNGWSYSSTVKGAAAGGVVSQVRTAGTGGVLVDLPALDVRAELNEGDDKLPDDGKLHFSGVTTDATPTVIAHIPIGENESLNIKTRFTGYTYQLPSSSKHIVGEIKQQLYRNIGSDVSEASEQSKLVEEGNAALDVDLGVVTASQTGKLTVTGYAGVRMVWSAEVEVQRISDKTYER